MCWDVSTTTEPIARKEYHCEASDWIVNSGFGEEDFNEDDWADIEKAREEGFKILPGMKYVKVDGKFEGDWCTFRARPELNRICQQYDLYDC